jgi:uncharacterized protein YecE (DUF72 family)
MKWNIGCSGFSYKEWKNVFYPPKLPQREWFNYYSKHFSTLELNVSFYRFPQLSMLQNWYDKSPTGFSFSVKAPRLVTHFKQLVDCEKYLDDFYSICREGLKEKLGPILFQFPPAFLYTEERLQRVTSSLDNSFVNVVEFRHRGWWDKKVYAALKKKRIIFCGQSYPGLPDEVVATTAIGYYRFHGIPRLYYSEYEISYLQKIADCMLQQKNWKHVYCYFNNTAALGAIANAKWIEDYVKTIQT